MDFECTLLRQSKKIEQKSPRRTMCFAKMMTMWMGNVALLTNEWMAVAIAKGVFHQRDLTVCRWHVDWSRNFEVF